MHESRDVTPPAPAPSDLAGELLALLGRRVLASPELFALALSGALQRARGGMR